MRLRTRVALVVALLVVAMFAESHPDYRLASVLSVVTAVVVLAAGLDFKQLPRWQRVVFGLVYAVIGLVIFFVLLVMAVGH